jgi:hypothetical protein
MPFINNMLGKRTGSADVAACHGWMVSFFQAICGKNGTQISALNYSKLGG